MFCRSCRFILYILTMWHWTGIERASVNGSTPLCLGAFSWPTCQLSNMPACLHPRFTHCIVSSLMVKLTHRIVGHESHLHLEIQLQLFSRSMKVERPLASVTHWCRVERLHTSWQVNFTVGKLTPWSTSWPLVQLICRPVVFCCRRVDLLPRVEC